MVAWELAPANERMNLFRAQWNNHVYRGSHRGAKHETHDKRRKQRLSVLGDLEDHKLVDVTGPASAPTGRWPHTTYTRRRVYRLSLATSGWFPIAGGMVLGAAVSAKVNQFCFFFKKNGGGNQTSYKCRFVTVDLTLHLHQPKLSTFFHYNYFFVLFCFVTLIENAYVNCSYLP